MATRDTYTKQTWENLPSEETPVSAERLEHIEQGIKDTADKRALKEIYDDDAINFGRKDGATAGYHSIAFGADTIAAGSYSHTEGKETTAGGYGSHAEGYRATAGADYSHAEGYQTTAGSPYAHAEGQYSNAVGSTSHAEGYQTTASATYSHAEGENATASGRTSHAEGYYANALGGYAHAEGYQSVAFGYSHAEGYQTQAGTDTMQYSHAEGHGSKAVGYYCHAEGYNTTSGSNSASYAHAEGSGTYATGLGSHAEGEGTTANGSQSHAEGYHTQAQAPYSHSEGLYTIANGQAQHVSGKYNISDMNQYAEIVGGGNSESDRRNIRTLDWKGNGWFSGDVTNGAGVSLNNLKSAVDNLESVAEGGSISKVFDTKAKLDEWLAVEGNTETLKTGQNIYIVETGTPDYWWDGTGLQILETEKVVIESMTYEETIEALHSEETGEMSKIPNLYAIRDWCKEILNPT